MVGEDFSAAIGPIRPLLQGDGAISMVGESLSRNRGRRACYCGATGVYKITG